MIYKKETEFAAHLKGQPLERVYLLYSSDARLKNIWKDKLTEKIVGKGMEEFNLHRFEGDTLDVRLLADALDALPVLAEHKAVVIENLDFCAMTKGDSDTLLELLEDVPEETVLIIAAAPVFGSSFEKKVKDKEARLIRAVDKAGCVAALGERTELEKRSLLQKLAQKQNCSIEDKAVKYLLQNTSDDLSSLQNEMDKLTAYLGEGTITLELVQQLSPKAAEARVFDLSKAVLAGRYTAAMEILDDLLYLKNKPTVILSNLSSAYLDLYRCKLAAGSGKTPAEVLKDFGYPSSQAFRVNNAFADCRKYSIPWLRGCIELLAQADYELKSSRAEDVLILQKTITALFAQAQ